jgi:hypothetical protein
MVDPTHYKFVAKAFARGQVVPFLGAGVNLSSRAHGEKFQPRINLPSGGELRDYLAESFAYPVPPPPKEPPDLLRVSQYAAVTKDTEILYAELRDLFNLDYPPTLVHDFLASMRSQIAAKKYPANPQLFVTTNYDDVLERAFDKNGEPYDLVCYVADGPECGKFRHYLHQHEDAPKLIKKPNDYKDLPLGNRAVILKIHGAVDRKLDERDSYVITEDHYIDYLAREDISQLVLAVLLKILKRSHFLFLGYSLSDWNLRVILRRIWGEQKLKCKSWAVQKDASEVDQAIWRDRNVDTLALDLADYLKGLQAAIENLPPRGGP